MRVRARNAAGASPWLAGTGTPAPTKTFALASATAAEGANASLTVTLGENAPAGGLALSVAYDYSGSASADDTGTTPTSVTVAANSSTATLTVPLADDDLVEGDETFEATLSTSVSGWNAASSGATATVTIEDGDDDDAKVAFGTDATATVKYAASADENVSGGMLNVPVTVSHLPGSPTTFAVEILNTGTATEYADPQNPGDFRIATKSVTFRPTDTGRTKNLAVAITNDSDLEADETIELRIAAASSPATALEDRYERDGSGATATVTIANDELPPAPTGLRVAAGHEKLGLSWTAPTLPQGASLTGYDVHYTSAPASGDGSVAADAAVQTGMDATAAAGWLDAEHTGTTAAHDVTGLDNGTEYRVRVRARNAAGAGPWLAGTGTPAPTKTFALASATAAEGANASLTVTLGENAPAGGLALSVSYDYSGSASADDTGTTPTSVTVAANSSTATLTVPLADDDLVEGDETFEATLSTSVSGWNAASSGATATVTIGDGDDDDAKVAFGNDAAGTSKHAVRVAENVSGGMLDVPVTVSHLPGSSTTFAVEVLNTGTATEYVDTSNPGDFRIGTKSVTFGPTDMKTKNLRVAITNDSTLEADETIELRIAPADQTATALEDRYERDGSGATATVTIANDELPPAPTGLRVAAGHEKLGLSWTAPTLPQGASADRLRRPLHLRARLGQRLGGGGRGRADRHGGDGGRRLAGRRAHRHDRRARRHRPRQRHRVPGAGQGQERGGRQPLAGGRPARRRRPRPSRSRRRRRRRGRTRR